MSSAPGTDRDGEPDDGRLRIDTVQLLAGALAAVTSALLGSRLGVNGTIIGAAFGSIVGTVGSAAYARFLARTATHVRTVVVRGPGEPVVAPDPTVALPEVAELSGRSTPPPVEAPAEPTVVWTPVDDGRGTPLPTSSEGATSELGRAADDTPATGSRQPWRVVGLGIVAAFAVALAVITGFELLSGKPLSALTGGGGDGGTTVTDFVDPPPAVPTPEPRIPSADPTTSPVEAPTSPPATPATPTAPPTSVGTTQPTSTTPPSTSPADIGPTPTAPSATP